MKKLKIIAWAGLAATCTITSAMAITPLPTGWYVELNGGRSKVTNISYASGSSISNTGIGWNLNGGYKFIPFCAAELGYTKYADSSSKINGVKIATATYYSYDVALKPILPVGDIGAEVFAKLGLAYLNTSVKAANASYAAANGISVTTGSHNTTRYYFGLGAEYYFIPSLALNAQWQRAQGNNKTGNLNLYSLGLSYLFG